jgi:hypothetical protein
MKLFAFTSKPADFDHWIVPPKQNRVITIDAGSPEFQRLMKMLRLTAVGAAETKLRIVTAPRPQ